MKTVLFDQKGKELWSIDLDKSIFGVETDENLIHRALVYQLANARKNVAHTKTRWERRGSTRKIYRQKWTGRARMGSNRSPIRKKGWVVFGPRNSANYTLSMNKKERRKAICGALTEKLKSKNLIVVDSIKLKEAKTKLMNNVFQSLKIDTTTLFAIPNKDSVLENASTNLPKVKTILTNYLNVKDLLKYKKLVLLKSSIENLEYLTK